MQASAIYLQHMAAELVIDHAAGPFPPASGIH